MIAGYKLINRDYAVPHVKLTVGYVHYMCQRTLPRRMHSAERPAHVWAGFPTAHSS